MEETSVFDKRFDFKLFINSKDGYHNTVLEKNGNLISGNSYEAAIQDSKIMLGNLFFLIKMYGIYQVDIYDMFIEKILDDVDLKDEDTITFMENVNQTFIEVLSYIDIKPKESESNSLIDNYKDSLKSKLRNKEKNIEKEVSSEKSLQAFKKQINDNPEFLKKVFKCYLTDVLEN